jgi:hypothetical protein
LTSNPSTYQRSQLSDLTSVSCSRSKRTESRKTVKLTLTSSSNHKSP